MSDSTKIHRAYTLVDPKSSALIQNIAFSYGFCWHAGETHVKYTDYNWLGIWSCTYNKELIADASKYPPGSGEVSKLELLKLIKSWSNE